MPRPFDPMLHVLRSEGPASDRAAQMMLYGQFVGSWKGRGVHHDLGGKEVSCEVHFGWVLEGRAIQDVWIMPARDDRAGVPVGGPDNWYGTTLRMYDPRKDFWRITWIDPAMQIVAQMRGRKNGEEIVQEYRIPDGPLGQWKFTEITDLSFRWVRQESVDGGKNWEVITEIFLRRVEDEGTNGAGS